MKRLLLSIALLFSIACGRVGNDGTLVGGPCADEKDCDSDSRCLLSKDFPGGTCAMNCTRHSDCPSGTRCVNIEGGVCLLECRDAEDCRGGYSCKGKRNAYTSSDDESLVCVE